MKLGGTIRLIALIIIINHQVVTGRPCHSVTHLALQRVRQYPGIEKLKSLWCVPAVAGQVNGDVEMLNESGDCVSDVCHEVVITWSSTGGCDANTRLPVFQPGCYCPLDVCGNGCAE